LFRLGNVVITRRRSYDQLKHFICNLVLIEKETYLPSIRELSNILNINKSSISRALIQLNEQDRWLDKIDRGSTRNSYYKIIADNEQCQQYKNYYLLLPSKKRKFRKMCEDARQKPKAGQYQCWAFGHAEWTKELAEYQQKL